MSELQRLCRAGYEFWLFPNLLSDQVDLLGAFIPFVSFQKPADGKSHLGTRIGGFVGVSCMMYMFYVYTPDESTMSFERANESILDMFSNANKPGIGPGVGYVAPKFGNDRNIDVDKIRQQILLEKQRKKEEAMRKKAQGIEVEEPELIVPSFPEVMGDDNEESEVEGQEETQAGLGGSDAPVAGSGEAANSGSEGKGKDSLSGGGGDDAQEPSNGRGATGARAVESGPEATADNIEL
jgi:hypothetical protein